MPFTPAHVAAVLPVVGRERPRWVVPCALVIGSMVPDVLYFVPIGDYRAVSHSLRGLVTLDLLLGLVLAGLWRIAPAPVLRDLSPPSVRLLVAVPRALDQREWLWSVPLAFARIEKLMSFYKAQLWVHHDFEDYKGRKIAPQYYE